MREASNLSLGGLKLFDKWFRVEELPDVPNDQQATSKWHFQQQEQALLRGQQVLITQVQEEISRSLASSCMLYKKSKKGVM